MEIIFNTLHFIDHASDKIKDITIGEDNSDLNSYVKDLLTTIFEGSSKRQFVFASDTCEVMKSISSILEDGEYASSTVLTAKRLLLIEKNAQKNVQHLDVEIHKGVLFQALVDNNKRRNLVIAKAEHNEFLEERDLKKRKGLPIKKKVYKAFLIELNSKNQIKDIFVYDTNSKISRYWWRDFLELVELTTDEQNTDKAFEAIDKGVLSKIKPLYPADHNIIRNSIVRYFRTSTHFIMDEFIDKCIGEYVPVCADMDVEKLKRQIRELPDKKEFDNRFNIIPGRIKAKQLRNIIPLTDKIELNIKEDVADLDKIITAVEERGVKYIKIKTDRGYEEFKTRD